MHCSLFPVASQSDATSTSSVNTRMVVTSYRVCLSIGQPGPGISAQACPQYHLLVWRASSGHAVTATVIR
eukprot:970026-Heterocapsa_arctica.AAC.1